MNPNVLFRPWHFLRARPRLSVGIACGLISVAVLHPFLPADTAIRWIVGWNIGAILYLISVWRMMCLADDEDILRRARHEDEGKNLVLLMALLAVIVSLWAIIVQAGISRNLHGVAKDAHIILTVLTIVSSWLFIHTMFALHYAHDYYLAQANGRPPCLDFPGGEEPDYRDFLYFSCIIGTSGQTADVSFTSRHSRRTGTLHCVFAFFYNAAILALMINIAAGLIAG